MPNWVSEQLNHICKLAGVQCTVTMDTSDYRKLFHIKNFGDYGVELTHGKATYILNPTDEMTLSTAGDEPKITQWFVFYDKAFNV